MRPTNQLVRGRRESHGTFASGATPAVLAARYVPWPKTWIFDFRSGKCLNEYLAIACYYCRHCRVESFNLDDNGTTVSRCTQLAS